MKTILLVDDELHAHRLARRALRTHRVLGAYSATEALDILAGIRVDLILVDLVLPDMDGFELVGTMRRRTPDHLEETPAVIWSADHRSETVARAEALRLSLLPKHTFGPDALASVVGELLETVH